MSLPAGTRVEHSYNHRHGTVAEWDFGNPDTGRYRSLVRWDDGYDQFVDDHVLAVADIEQGVLL